MMTFEQYVSDLPLLHSWDEGKTWVTGGFYKGLLQPLIEFMGEKLPSSPAILETGAGNSTISFLFLKPSRLVSIDPHTALFERVRDYCEKNGIATDALEAIVEGSQWALPVLAAQTRNTAPPFDFVLMDGQPNWPLVFVDFCYANFMLKTGGYIMLQNLHLHSVKELGRLLSEQPDFKLVLNYGKALLFQRITEARELPRKWTECKYIARKSEEYQQLGKPSAL